MRRIVFLTSLILGLAAFGSALVPLADAHTSGPGSFEPPAFSVGNINGQQGWQKTGGYDVAVASVASFPAASRYGFGTQALRLSDAVTSGSFGDQTFTPSLSKPAGESPARKSFTARFEIGTALATEQVGLHMAVSPDDGNGGRMSYLRFEDHADGVHVFFDDVTDNGPLGTVAEFNETDIATLSRTHAHSIRFSIRFKTGPGNDRVAIFIDGKKEISGTTWEDYYRYDPEQAGNGNKIPAVDKLLFRESGTANPANAGNGFLVDGVSASSHEDGHHGHKKAHDDKKNDDKKGSNAK